MTTPARVLVVIDHLGAGGAQEFICQLYQQLDPQRVTLDICAMRSGGVYQEQLAALGAEVRVLASGRSLLHLPESVLRLRRLVRARRYDCIHTVLQGSFVCGTPLARWAGVPTVHTLMSVRQQVQPWYFPLMALWQRWVDLFVTCIPIELVEMGVRQTRIRDVEMTIDLAEMLAVAHNPQQPIAPFDLAGAFPVALSIGRLHPDKGHEYALRSWPAVLQRWPQARLLIVGDGDDGPRLRQLADQLGLSGSALFAGFRSDLADLFARADLVLRTSINEGVNLTTIQALAAGLPVVGFANRVPREIIVDRGNGLLVAPRDAAQLAAAIQALAADAPLRQRLGEQGRADVRSAYDVRQVVAFYEQLYRMLAQRQSLAALPDQRRAARPVVQPLSLVPAHDD